MSSGAASTDESQLIGVTESVAVNTRNNFERKQELIKSLKGKKYNQYVTTLNKMLEDPKTQALLVDGFGGELADMELKFKERDIPVTALLPTQSEIDVQKSIEYALRNPKNIANYYSGGGVEIIMPIITFRHNYVIDGHHRWSQIFAFNPDAKATAYDFDNPKISPLQMLKATQGAIAAVMAQKGEDEGLPQNKVDGKNLYDDKWDENAIRKYINDTVNDAGTKAEIISMYSRYKGLTLWDEIVEFITDNLMQLKNNNYPVQGAPSRGEMPQTDQASGEGGNAGPDAEDSALGKLRFGGITGGAVK
jgi:hypothetical protein